MPADVAPTDMPRGFWVFARPNDDPVKILAVAVTLCLVCSLLVSGATILLKPLQERNQNLAIRKQIVAVAGFPADTAQQVEEQYRQHIEPRVVVLDSGDFDDSADPENFDLRALARDPATSRTLGKHEDPAGIKRRPAAVPVYLVRDGTRIRTIILPVYGYGLWSTLYGFLALDGDARTVAGLTFYDHGETPGLGDFVANPAWQAQFRGKLAFDEQGKPRLSVTKDSVPAGSPAAGYQVDAVSGATLTSKGVNNLLHYWLGAQGFGPLLARLQAGGGTQ